MTHQGTTDVDRVDETYKMQKWTKHRHRKSNKQQQQQ